MSSFPPTPNSPTLNSELPTPRSPRWWKRLAGTLALLLLAWLAVSYAAAYQFTRRPRPMFPEPPPTVGWGSVERLQLQTDDGQTLGGWFVDGRSDRLPVLLLHGHGGCRRSCLPDAKLAASAGHPVLLISMRAHGDSTGDSTDFGYSARRDVRAAVEWLDRRCPQRRVVLWGQSMGAAAAIFAAADLGDRAAGYLLVGPYQDLRTAVRNRMQLRLPPLLDTVASTGLETVAPLVLADVDRIAPVEAIARVPPSARVLIVAGGADRHARPEEALALVSRCAAPAELVKIPDAAHGRWATADPPRYEDAVLRFLQEVEATAPAQ